MTSDPLAPLAARLGLAPGSLYTLLVGMVLALALTLTGPTAAFTERRVLRADTGLGSLASPAPAPPAPVVAPAPAVPAPAVPAVPTTTIPAIAVPVPAAVVPTSAAAPPTTTIPAPSFGDRLASAEVAGRVTSAAVLADGVLVAVDRDDADPLLVRLDDDGARTGSVVLTGRDLGADVDIAGVTLDGSGAVLALVAGPHEVVRVSADGSSVETLAAIPDLPPCAIPLPLPTPCEPGLTDGAPAPAGIAVVGDRIVVADPGQGVLFAIGADGSVSIAAADESYRASDDGPGLGGVAARSSSVAVAFVGRTVVDFELADDEVVITPVTDLDRDSVAIATTPSGEAVLVHADGSVRFERGAELAAVKGASAAAPSGADTWLAAYDAGSRSSTLLRLHTQGTP